MKEKTKRVSYRLPESVDKNLASLAAQERRTKTAVLLLALEDYFKTRKRKNPLTAC